MSRTYKAIGINLKTQPMGESDRLLTILTQEQGLIRAIAPGARKHKSSLSGRSGLFVINDLLIAKGKSLGKVTQAETRQSFPKLSSDLAKLTASQYLAELVLCQALSDQSQTDLFNLLIEHLERLERASKASVLACLAHATFHLLALAGVAPQVHQCCVSRSPLVPDLSNPDWRVGFSLVAGGTVHLAELTRLHASNSVTNSVTKVEAASAADQPMSSGSSPLTANTAPTSGKSSKELAVHDDTARYDTGGGFVARGRSASAQVFQLTATELVLLQQLNQADLIAALPITEPSPAQIQIGPHRYWYRIERILRQYAQYQFDRPIRSAALIDTCFSPP
ncbi:MAG: DNA repair protein RecO [Cyanobacteria bacterium P01_A01_bin.123]